MRAGYCSECATNVWLTDGGTCANGHPASSITGVYEVGVPTPPPEPSVRTEIPRWASALWGLVLTVLNLWLIVYVIGFTALFGSLSTGAWIPEWLSRLFFDEQAFMSMFGVVGFSVFISFAFLALSFTHVFAWSGLPIDRKLVWAAVIFAGMQPGMLVYWYANVWRRPAKQRARRMPVDTPIRRVWLIVLGVLTVLPVVYFAYFFLSVGAGMSGMASESLLDSLPVMHLAVMLLLWGLTAFYLVHAFRNPRLEGTNRAAWAVAVAFGGPIAWPIYWYMNMWRTPPDEHAYRVVQESVG